MLGRGHCVAVRRVHHHDAALRRRRHIDIVDADAGSPDDFQVTRRLENGPRYLGRGSHRQTVIDADESL